VGDRIIGSSGHPSTGWLPKNGAWMIGGLLLMLQGCAGAPCHPVSITVAKKEDRARLEAVPRGYTSETGGLQEIRKPEVVRDYWVQDASGTWYRVTLEQYQKAQVGQNLELCQ